MKKKSHSTGHIVVEYDDIAYVTEKRRKKESIACVPSQPASNVSDIDIDAYTKLLPPLNRKTVKILRDAICITYKISNTNYLNLNNFISGQWVLTLIAESAFVLRRRWWWYRRRPRRRTENCKSTLNHYNLSVLHRSRHFEKKGKVKRR